MFSFKHVEVSSDVLAAIQKDVVGLHVTGSNTICAIVLSALVGWCAWGGPS